MTLIYIRLSVQETFRLIPDEVDAREIRLVFTDKSMEAHVNVLNDPFSTESLLVSRKLPKVLRGPSVSPTLPPPSTVASADLRRVLKPMEWPKELKVGDRCEIIVEEVYSPDRFYVNLKRKDLNQRLLNLMAEMK